MHRSCCIPTHLAVVQDHNPAAAHDRAEAVRNDQSGAAAKRTADRLLDQAICLYVNSCRCLVHYQNLQWRENRNL